MCLVTVTWSRLKKFRKKPKRIVKRYKALLGGMLPYRRGMYRKGWNKAVNKEIRRWEDDDKYWTGFHVFLTEKDAQSWLSHKGWRNHCKISIIEVDCIGLLAKGTEMDVPVEVYNWIRVRE